MRLETQGYNEACGIWEESENRIIIKRDQLEDLTSFAGTLIHETAHALSNASDITIEFENELTYLLGKLTNNMLN